jgi:hypothetical protein
LSANTFSYSHTHVTRGNAEMEAPKKETPKKVHKIGNTTLIVHSPLVAMTEEERAEWFKNEWEKGNSVLKEIAAAVEDCYRD